ncbi:MAG: hypothetical protein M1820_001385 [Bogoriella megaspora]|nr:MAG: hypothetical protein M1820_001385 [Bogoriella megaspora]
MTFKSALKAALVASIASQIQALPLLGNSFGIPGDNATYDYVVVGSGPAGATVALRLVEQGAGTVALIEAGSFYEISNGNQSQVTAYDGYYGGRNPNDTQPLIDWGYVTTPQAGSNGQRLHFARGKTFGGCSAINFNVYHRATVGSYQNWADQVGDDSFTFENFLPWYKKSINFTDPLPTRFANATPQYNASVIGDQKGPLHLGYPNYAQVQGTYGVGGYEELGLPVIDGLLAGELIGQSWTTFTINPDNGNRESSETSFVQTGIKNYETLKLYQLTLGKKILFDSNKKATGLLVDTLGAEYILSANKEVILAGGTIGSPQLLMTSGIGPASTLNGLDIPVIVDNPAVGQGMQDQVLYDVVYEINAPSITTLSNDPEFAAEQLELYNQVPAQGMFTSTDTDVLAFERIPEDLQTNWSSDTKDFLATYPDDWPHVEYITIPNFLGNTQNSRLPPPPKNLASMVFVLTLPRSRGNMTIVSADTAVHPEINPNWLTEQSDIDIMIAAFKRMRQMWGTDSMSKLKIGDEFYPGTNVSTDAEIERSIRNNFNQIWHATSTVSMGQENDTNSVVDVNGKVYGVTGVRVVDASIFPFLPPGHPMSTIYALAEKIACNISGKC